MTNEEQKSTEWILSRKPKSDSINFDLVKKWIETCEVQRRSKCAEDVVGDALVKRPIDVEDVDTL